MEQVEIEFLSLEGKNIFWKCIGDVGAVEDKGDENAYKVFMGNHELKV